MIDLDQTRQLQSRVHKAIALIESLRKENGMLRRKLAEYEQRVGELEVNVSNYSREQAEIEEGILSALNQLDRLEDEIAEEAEATDSHRGASARTQAQTQKGAGPEGGQEMAKKAAVQETAGDSGNGKLGIFR